MTEQCLYLMSVPRGLYKIGISRDPEKRRAELQSANPDPVRLLCASPPGAASWAREMERETHRLLDTYRVSGEWFSVPPYLVFHAVRVAAIHPQIRERWERLCQRPHFVARHAAFLALKCDVFTDENIWKAWGHDAFIEILNAERQRRYREKLK